MCRKKGQAISQISAALLLIAFIIIIFFIFYSPTSEPELNLASGKLPLFVFSLIFSLVVLIITFVNTDMALIILIFSMLLSPEFKLAEVPAREVVVRMDDILLGVVFFGWLAKMALNKDLGLLRRTSLTSLILGYIAVCIISTIVGIVNAYIIPLTSFFYVLKYIQYFMLYFLVTNNIRDQKQVKTFIIALLLTCVIVCIYTLPQIGVLSRTTAPFEGKAGEANTLAGYLVLLFAVSIGIFLYSRSRTWKIFTGIVCFFIIPSFIFTLSRSSYLAFIVMYSVIILVSRSKRLFLIAGALLVVCIVFVFLPQVVDTITGRIASTFTPYKTYHAFGKNLPLEQSAVARVEGWRTVFRYWLKSPILGYGVTGVGLVDIQYPRVLGETGIIGFVIFIWLLILIFRNSLAIFKGVKNSWAKGLSLGFLAGFTGLLVQGFGANTFIIVRIMEPFWFLAAIVMMLPYLEEFEVVDV